MIKKIRSYNEQKAYSIRNEEKRKRRIKKRRQGQTKIRVGFYCDGGQFWSTFSDLYDLLVEDPRFETVVIATPEMHQNKIYHYNAIEFLDSRKIPYIKAWENNRWLDINKLDLHYVFYNRHYLSRQPRKVSFKRVRKHSKICYIPYATCPQNGEVQDTLCRFDELRGFDYLFSENELMTQIYESYKQKFPNAGTTIATVGSPKFVYALANTTKGSTHEKKYVQSVLYTPRWCFSEGTSSFLELKDFFFDMAKNNKNIEYIFRPHPLMKQTLDETFGEEFWQEFLGEFDKYENAEVDLKTDYMDSFSRASVLVSDISTMMFEFSVTEKPVIYLYKADKLNEFGREAAKGYYYCYSAEDVDETLKNIREGNDPCKELRRKISQELYCNGNASVVEKIRSILLEDFEER
nr:CDP-glycerol glycerophosphotransferase family protein [Eubacterium sp.]